MEDIFVKKLPGFKKEFNKGTFRRVIFSQLARIIVKAYIPEVADIHQTKRILELLMLSTREKKSV